MNKQQTSNPASAAFPTILSLAARLGLGALVAVGALVGLPPGSQAQTCELVGLCGDLDGSGKILVSDALNLLKKAVGQDIPLQCQCSGEGSGTCSEDLATCQADLAACLALPVCGNGVIEDGEDCDAGDMDGQTCQTQGFEGGELACAYCVFDTEECYVTRFDGSGPTVLDLETGLEWEKKDAADQVADYDNPHDADNEYTWCAGQGQACDVESAPLDGTIATDFLARLNGNTTGVCYLDRCDWRLPSLAELQSISLSGEECESSPCVAEAALLPMRSSYYWSSTSYVLDPDIAWLLNFNDGASSASFKPTLSFVRAVRSGP